jgi:hypothetical protein
VNRQNACAFILALQNPSSKIRPVTELPPNGKMPSLRNFVTIRQLVKSTPGTILSAPSRRFFRPHAWRRQLRSIALSFAASDDRGMEYLIGVILSLAVFAFALVTGLDRDRVFYPTLLFVIATYYILFAVMGASVHAVLIESLVAGSFLAIAVVGFKTNLWFVAVALAGHGVLTFFIICSLKILASRCGGLVFVWRSILPPVDSLACF